jgi:hypothetical protein
MTGSLETAVSSIHTSVISVNFWSRKCEVEIIGNITRHGK